MAGQGQGLRSSASLTILYGFSFLVVSALVVEDDLLMVESQNDGPAMVMVPPPPGMMEVTEDDGDQLMVESREAQPLAMALASPERSAVDQHQFAMAANYLKNQFAIPHHLVPSYQDISRRSGLMKRRLGNLPNIENHRFNPEISPYDVPKIEELQKNPEEYKKANIYRMDNLVAPSSQQRTSASIHRRKFDVKPPARTSNSGFRRSRLPPKPKLTRKFDTPSLLSSLLSPFNAFRSGPEPEDMRKFGAIPDKFRYPLPREHRQPQAAVSGRRRSQPEVSGRKPFREVLNNQIEKKYEPDQPSKRGTPLKVEKKREPVKYKERRRLQRKPEVAIRKNLNNSLLRKRVSASRPRAGGQRSDDKDLVWRSKEDIDGLDLSFWVDEADLSTTAKPDYRRRWRNLTQQYEEEETSEKTLSTIDRVDIDMLNEKEEVIEEAAAVTNSQKKPLFHDWGDSLWDEIQEDWGEDDAGDIEDKFSDLSARYLNAWADVARIGTAAARKSVDKKTNSMSAKTQTKDILISGVKPAPKPSGKMLNIMQSDGIANRPPRPPQRRPPSQYINRRRPIKRTRL